MSTAADRRFRCARRILPIKVIVRQTDGSRLIQQIDASVRVPKRRRPSKADRALDAGGW